MVLGVFRRDAPAHRRYNASVVLLPATRRLGQKERAHVCRCICANINLFSRMKDARARSSGFLGDIVIFLTVNFNEIAFVQAEREGE